MYTNEELEGRIFAPNKAEWVEAALKDYRSKEESAVRAVERGMLLPLKKISGAPFYEGGVCDARFRFVAGFRRSIGAPVWATCEKSYKVTGGG